MATEPKKTSLGTIKLRKVRLSFAHLYEPQEGRVDEETGKKGEDKYNCNLLFSKSTPEGKELLRLVKATAEEVKKAKWGNNIPKLKPEKVCMRDGNLEDYDGYDGHYYISASNAKQPVLVDRRKDPKTGKWLPSPTGQLYSGCYVNAVINVWAQDNKYGKRLNASIESVQFYRDGEAFGMKQVDPNEAFDDDDADDEDFDAGMDDDDDDDLL